jgi:hypothetical protein
MDGLTFSTGNEDLSFDNNPDDSVTTIIGEYYSKAFALFNDVIAENGFDLEKHHPIRRRFWSLLIPRTYAPYEIKPFLKQYIKSIEKELESTIKKHSLAYWLHIYRRIGPYPAGRDKKPMTTGLVRVALEAAFQKYAQFTPCNSIGISKDTPIEKILSGLLLSENFEFERRILEESPKQMVLTNFSSIDMLEIYNIEKLAYEMWRSTAALRIIGKGASVVVTDSEPFFFDNRSDELRNLIQLFDSRHLWNENSSLTGISFANLSSPSSDGMILLPTYNLGHIFSNEFGELFEKVFGFTIKMPVVFNFIWLPINIRDYRKAHHPFSQGFFDLHKVDLDSVLLVIAALANSAFVEMITYSSSSVFRYWQRAYEGPISKENVVNRIFDSILSAARILDIPEDNIDRNRILGAIRFLALTDFKRNSIDLDYPGPHMIFIPYNDNSWFIDYAWIHRLLYNLFLGVYLDDQKFKGDTLEKVVNFQKSILPTKPCKHINGQKKQIDASFAVGSRLVILECKAIGKSIAFDKGDANAIEYRVDKFNKALKEVDEKASWLASHPQGTNYDIRNYNEILPIVISPFIEYTPSLNKFYWLNTDIPRVITPIELKLYLDNGKFTEELYNVVKIQK